MSKAGQCKLDGKLTLINVVFGNELLLMNLHNCVPTNKGQPWLDIPCYESFDYVFIINPLLRH